MLSSATRVSRGLARGVKASLRPDPRAAVNGYVALIKSEFNSDAALNSSQKPQLMTKLSNTVSPPEIRKAWDVAASVDFNVGKLKHLLDHDNHEMRDKFREFMRQPLFTPR